MEYNALDASFVGGGLDGWTIYTPTTGAGYVDIVGPPAPPWWQDPSVYALVAFVTVVIAAVVDACAVRRLIPGIVTVAAPFMALVLFVLATPGGIEGVVPDKPVSLIRTSLTAQTRAAFSLFSTPSPLSPMTRCTPPAMRSPRR